MHDFIFWDFPPYWREHSSSLCALSGPVNQIVHLNEIQYRCVFLPFSQVSNSSSSQRGVWYCQLNGMKIHADVHSSKIPFMQWRFPCYLVITMFFFSAKFPFPNVRANCGRFHSTFIHIILTAYVLKGDKYYHKMEFKNVLIWYRTNGKVLATLGGS